MDPVDSISISMVLNEFSRHPLIRQLAEENGMSAKLFMTAFRFVGYFLYFFGDNEYI